MKYLLTITALVLVSSLMACSGLSAGQIESVREALTPLVTDGKMTQQQLEMLIQALSGGGFDWGSALTEVGQTILTIVGSLYGVRLWRGGVTSRKGSAPSAKVS